MIATTSGTQNDLSFLLINKIQETERKNTTTNNKGMVDKLLLSSKIVVLEELLVFINSLPDEKPSEVLEEAASRYAKEEYSHKSPATLPDRCKGCYAPLMYAFKDGANWQKEQMMKSAIDAKIVNDESSGCVVDCAQGCLVLEPNTYPIGQKLKILIIKEAEQ